MAEDKQSPKEIDLLELFSLIGKGIKNGLTNALRAILFLIVFGIKKAHFLVLFAISGGLIGLSLHSLSDSYYTSGMVIKPNGIQSTELIEYLNDLTGICETGNNEALASALSIDDSLALKIKSIEAFPYVDVNLDGIGDFIDFDNVYNPKDTTQQILRNRLYLQVSLFESQPKEYLQNGIENYILKNEYMVQLNNIRKTELREQIAQTEIEIIKLDSLQNQEYFNENNSQPVPVQSGGYILYTEKDKRLYYQNKLGLIKSKQTLQKEYELIQGPITIIKNMSELAKEANPRGIMIIKFGFWFGVIGYFSLLIFNYKNYFITEIESI